MRNDWRRFFVYDLEIGAKKDGAVAPDMEAVGAVWQKMHAASRIYPVRGGEGSMLIGGINIDPMSKSITVLVRLSDKAAPNSVYSDPNAGTFQEHMKASGQGSDLGCHVFISSAEQKSSPNVYTCIIEHVQGLPAALIQRALSKMLNYEFNENGQSFKYPHPGGGNDRNGNPKFDRCCPHVELRGRPSDRLINDVNNGVISGISLIRTETATQLGGASYLKKKETELKLSIDKSLLPANPWSSLKAVFSGNAANFPVAKLSYKTPGSARAVTVEINAATGSPLTELYVDFFEKSPIFPFLANSSSTIVPHLRGLVIPELAARRDI
jgi:hypothetical protein